MYQPEAEVSMTVNVRVINDPPAALVAIVMIPAVIGGLCYLAYNLIIDFQSYSAPYNVLVGFYYYTVVLPFKSIGMVFGFLNNLGITPFPNLNFCITLLLTVFYIFFQLFILAWICETVGEGMVPVLFVLPGLLALGLLILQILFLWLFAI
ncbi:hypothetical protein [Spongorhabdus nitratireducens]